MRSRAKDPREAVRPASSDALTPLTPDQNNLFDPERVQRIEGLVRLLDDAIRIPGTNWRLGLDSLVGLVPGAGDLASMLLSAYILKESARLGASRGTLARMVGNLAFDLTIGAIPLLGDVFDVAFKANRRNMRLLQKHLARMHPQSAHDPPPPRPQT